MFHKEVIYFLAVLPKTSALTPQEEEVAQAAWVPLSQVQEISYPDTWALLKTLLESRSVRSILAPAVAKTKAAPSKSFTAGTCACTLKKNVAKRAVNKRSTAGKRC